MTDPRAEVEALRKLIESWEASAQKIDERTAFRDPVANIAAANTLRFCASRLAAVLAILARPAPPSEGLPVLDWSYGNRPTYDLPGRCLTCGQRFIVRREKGIKPPLSVECPECKCSEYSWRAALATPTPDPLDVERLALLDELERLWKVEAAARTIFASEDGVCVECGWVGDHNDRTADSFARECLTLPLRRALASTEPSAES